jgi:hypothetical protein
MNFTALFGLLGSVAILITLIVIGLLSYRLGQMTHAKPYYVGFFAAGLLMLISIAAGILDAVFHLAPLDPDWLWLILDDGLPALAVTIGVIFAWRYWSWLLAERD